MSAALDKPEAVDVNDLISDSVVERLTTLMLTIPNWPTNYTATRDQATWVVKQAKRVGWFVEVPNTGRNP